jgi:hypothetical protein
MQIRCLKSLKMTLGIISAFHLLVGFFTLIPRVPKDKIASIVYRATVDSTPQLMHVAEMAGCYMFTIGFMAFLALKDPLKNIVVIKGLQLLLGLRLISIILFSGQAYDVFGIPPLYYWGNFSVIAVLLTSLIILRPKPEQA